MVYYNLYLDYFILCNIKNKKNNYKHLIIIINTNEIINLSLFNSSNYNIPLDKCLNKLNLYAYNNQLFLNFKKPL